MATGVNVKMGVSGVSQFKQGMKESQQAVKTLDEALKLNEAQLKLNGNEELYLQNKSELLERQIQAQSNVVRQAESALKAMQQNGVSPASKEFQAMQQQVYKSSAQLVTMKADLENVGAAGEEAQSGVTDMNASLKRIGDGVNIRNVTDSIDKITDRMKNAAMAAWRMGEAVVRATLGAGSWADDLVTEATQWEITPEELQRMRKTANLIDTDVDTILGAQQKLRQNMGKESKEALGAFADFVTNGLLPEDYDPRKRNAVDVFWDAGEALMKLNDEYDKQVYAQELFGKSWRELIPLFSTGRKEYEETMAGWSVVSDETVNSLGEMDDQYQKLSNEFETFKTELLGAFAGPLTEGMGILEGFFKELNEYLQTENGQRLLESLGNTVTGLFEDLKGIDPEEVIQGFSGVFDSIVNGFKWVDEHKEGVVKALEYIVIGWGALKLAGGALQILELIQGITGLTGGAAAAAEAGTTMGTSWATAFGSAALKAVPWLAGLITLITPAGTVDSSITMQDFVRMAYEGDEYAKGVMDQVSARYADTYEGIVNTPGFQEALSQGFIEIDELFDRLERNYGWKPYEEPKQAEPEEHREGYGTGEFGYYRDRRTGEILEDPRLTNSIDRMNQVIGETNATNQMVAQNSLTPADISAFTGLPGQIAAAVQAGVASIQITIDASAVDAMTPRVGWSMWNSVAQYVK